MPTNIIREIKDYNRWTPRELIMEYTARASTKGEGKRYNAVTELAQNLGVSRRSVERYITTKGAQRRKPGKATQEKLNELGQQFKKPRPAKFELDGEIAVAGHGKGYQRARTIQLAKWIDDDAWDYLSELAILGEEEAIWQDLASYYQVSYLEMVSGEISIR